MGEINKVKSKEIFLNWIYKNSSIHMNRKYLMYLKAIKIRKEINEKRRVIENGVD